MRAKVAITEEGRSLKANIDPNFKLILSHNISPEQKKGLRGFPKVMCQGAEGEPESALAIPIISILYFEIVKKTLARILLKNRPITS